MAGRSEKQGCESEDPGAHSIGGKVSELLIDVGPGYRVYFTRMGQTIVLLLCGGDKSSQAADIRLAKRMIEGLEESTRGH